ncbi:helix-turn-helix transcriptional regulator [Actinophytocola sp.]|uniref:helix-turn-helix domain-containing protein n=1 Tax=Actinophytocola sp. TaxID=1872138 RepID=UPI002ED16D47
MGGQPGEASDRDSSTQLIVQPFHTRIAPLPVLEPLSDSEIRVLRYLPTNLSAPEIANELSVSRNTVKTHIRNLYQKLGAHRRAEAVARPHIAQQRVGIP